MLWRYLAALFYDACILLAVFMLVTMVLLLARSGAAIEPGSRWYQLLLLAVTYMYYVGSLLYGRQTIGMKAWRLRLEVPSASSPFVAIHLRILLFWPAFALANWYQNARADFLSARGAAILYCIRTKEYDKKF